MPSYFRKLGTQEFVAIAPNCHPPLDISLKPFNGSILINPDHLTRWNLSEADSTDTMLDLSCPSSVPSTGPPQSRILPMHDHSSLFQVPRYRGRPQGAASLRVL
jgi:hypothetical protein